MPIWINYLFTRLKSPACLRQLPQSNSHHSSDVATASVAIYIYIYIHYITLHYITVHYITFHYITYIHACIHTYMHTYIHTLHIYNITHIYTYTKYQTSTCSYIYTYISPWYSVPIKPNMFSQNFEDSGTPWLGSRATPTKHAWRKGPLGKWGPGRWRWHDTCK